MRIPSFTADASLRPAWHHYSGRNIVPSVGSGGVHLAWGCQGCLCECQGFQDCLNMNVGAGCDASLGYVCVPGDPNHCVCARCAIG